MKRTNLGERLTVGHQVIPEMSGGLEAVIERTREGEGEERKEEKGWNNDKQMLPEAEERGHRSTKRAIKRHQLIVRQNF
jgi:hypothetical protein